MLYLYVYLFLYLFIYIFIFIHIYFCFYLSICLSDLSIHLPIYIHFWLFIYSLFIRYLCYEYTYFYPEEFSDMGIKRIRPGVVSYPWHHDIHRWQRVNHSFSQVESPWCFWLALFLFDMFVISVRSLNFTFFQSSEIANHRRQVEWSWRAE